MPPLLENALISRLIVLTTFPSSWQFSFIL